jgi:hypothetical protein
MAAQPFEKLTRADLELAMARGDAKTLARGLRECPDLFMPEGKVPGLFLALADLLDPRFPASFDEWELTYHRRSDGRPRKPLVTHRNGQIVREVERRVAAGEQMKTIYPDVAALFGVSRKTVENVWSEAQEIAAKAEGS